jgi:hypothetical protein
MSSTPLAGLFSYYALTPPCCPVVSIVERYCVNSSFLQISFPTGCWLLQHLHNPVSNSLLVIIPAGPLRYPLLGAFLYHFFYLYFHSYTHFCWLSQLHFLTNCVLISHWQTGICTPTLRPFHFLTLPVGLVSSTTYR